MSPHTQMTFPKVPDTLMYMYTGNLKVTQLNLNLAKIKIRFKNGSSHSTFDNSAIPACLVKILVHCGRSGNHLVTNHKTISTHIIYQIFTYKQLK